MEANYTKKYLNSLGYSFGTRKNCLKNGKNPLLFQFIRKAIKWTNNSREMPLLSTSYKILSNILVARMIPYANEIIENIIVGLGGIVQPSTTYLAFGKHLKRGRNTIMR